MAQTWPFSRRRKFFLALTDVIGRALTWPLRRAGKLGRAPLTVHRVLVIEPWNVGDVVLATPILRELRRRYPEAKISVLAKPYARALLHGSGLADEVIPFDLPWTA